jgi:RimJ/RimL family protein N-acetyltransferase
VNIPTSDDLLAEIAEQYRLENPEIPEGAFTRRQFQEREGLKKDAAKNYLERLFNKGQLNKIRIGCTDYYYGKEE